MKGFGWTTEYEKLRVEHHSDWLNYINHFGFTALFSISAPKLPPQLFLCPSSLLL